MSHPLLRSLLVAAFCWTPSLLMGQVPGAKPTPEQAQQLLQTRPDIVARLRQQMLNSGMSPEQIRARLREQGYPQDLLDAYMPGATGEAASPSSTVFRAVQDLGIADTTDLTGATRTAARKDTLRAENPLLGISVSPLRYDTLSGAARDSVIRLITSRDSGFVIFGLDLFRSSTTQFQPNTAGPVDATYRLGPGDRLVLILTGDVEASYALDVTREGFVVIPQVGQLYVNNLTLGDLEVLLGSRLGRIYSGVRRDNSGSTRYSISVARLRSNQVFVVGDVQHPGSYGVSSAGTALTALYAAGGPSINGSLRRIEVRRAGKVADALDVYDYLVRGDASHDVRLQSGDIIFVPVHGPRARLVGEVVRPATYELKQGEGIAQLLEAAGGFTASAARRRVLVERIVPASQRTPSGGERTTVDITSDAFTSLGAVAPIENGDVIRVFPIAERVRNRIAVLGNVNTPGPQGLRAGMRLSDALRAAGGLRGDTYLGEVLITRITSDSVRLQLRTALASLDGTPVDDITLNEDDQIQVFSVSSFRPTRYVAIAGHVNKPGRYLYRAGMTVRDLILLGGGVKEGASLREAEVARLPADRTGGQTAITIRVPLDSSYLFERQQGRPYFGPPGTPTSAGGSPDFVLDPYDNVLVLRQASFEYQRTVTLNGEVQFPGAYALKTKQERLSDVIQRAGGLTDEAQRDAILFVRKGPSTYTVANNATGALSTTPVQDSITRARATNGRIGLDLFEALRHHDAVDNIVLEDGDEITILRFNPVVRVQGAVNAPANVTYVRGRDIYYYIAAAGGGSRVADEGRAYVTQANGKLESVRSHVFRPTERPEPGPGSVVTVPDRDPADKKDYIAIAGAITSVLASLVTIVILITRKGA